METTVIKIPVHSFRKIASPYDEQGINSYFTVLNLKDVPNELDGWREVNVRDAKLNGAVAKTIAKSLVDAPNMFFFKNRGLTIIAEKVRYDNKTGKVEIEFKDKKHNGLLDGGHTFKVIQQHITSLESQEELDNFEAFIKVEIIEGIDDMDEIIQIVDARNTSEKVKLQSLEELHEHFESIKKVLKDKSYADDISYKEYELNDSGVPKSLDIKDILSYLICFDGEGVKKGDHPIKAYTSKAAVLDLFVSRKDELKKLIPLLPKILELRDTIYRDLPKAHDGRFGGLKGVNSKKQTHLDFLGTEASHTIPSGFIYPQLAAFRTLVECKDDKCIFVEDPIKLYDSIKEELASIVCDQAVEFVNPNKLGKDKATWRMCYDNVRVTALERGLLS